MMHDTIVGVVMGKHKEKLFYSIYNTNKTLDPAQCNYTVIEKEMLVLIYVFDKF